MSLVRYLWRQSRSLALLATIAGAVSGLASSALVTVIHRGIAAPSDLTWLGLAFAGLCTLFFATKVVAEVSLLHLTQAAILRLRIDLSHKLLVTPLPQLAKLGKHRLIAILTEDITVFSNAFEWVPHLFINAVVVAACLGYLAVLSWPLVLLLALVLVVGLAAFHLGERGPLRQLARVRDLMDVAYQHVRGLVDGNKELKLNARRAAQFVDGEIAPNARELRRWTVRGMTGYAIAASTGMMMLYLNIGILLFAAPYVASQPAHVLAGFAITLLYMIRPVVDMMMALPTLRRASIALGRIRHLGDELAAVEPPGPDGFPADAARIELRGIEHRYPGDDDRHFSLGPIDLALEPGEIVFVVGGNGSGKSTLALLLLGLHAPDTGQILLEGQPVTDETRHHYRQRFSAVLADFHLFEQLPAGADPERAGAYLRALRMDHKVRIVDGRFSTIELSSGQRKRLALVAAYLEDRPVYVFDEWAADQDPDFKRVFYRQLLPELRARGKTVVVISHDDAFFDAADRIVRLDDGRIRAIERPARPAVSRMPPLHGVV